MKKPMVIGVTTKLPGPPSSTPNSKATSDEKPGYGPGRRTK